mgnify:FL=1
MSYQCKKCGSNVPEDALFCSKCGEKITALRCPSCGKRLPEDSAFCTYCGAKIIIEPSMSPQPNVQQTVDTTETAPNTAVPPAAELSPSEQQQTAANQKVPDQKPQPAEAVAPPPPEKPEKEAVESGMQPHAHATGDAEAVSGNDNEDEVVVAQHHYHLTRRVFAFRRIWLSFSNFESTDFDISDSSVLISDSRDTSSKEKLDIVDLRQISVGMEVSPKWLCIALFFTFACLLGLVRNISVVKTSPIFFIAFMSWIMTWQRKIVLYRKDGKRIATRGREKAVMLELKQDLLCRIEAEPDYTGDLSDVVIKNTQYYLPEFEKARRNEKCRFNWTAFLFAGVFSYYRKSQDIFWQYYKWPLIIYAAIMLGISGSGFLAVKSVGGIIGWLIAVYVLSLAVSIYLLITCIRFGKSFNREYYQHCMVLAESSELSPRTTGVSAKNAVLFCLVAGLCAFGITAIATGLSGAAFLGGISDNASLDDIGFSGNASELSKADIVGRWNLVYYEDDDTVFSRESLVEGGASADDVEDYLSKNCVLFQVDDFCKFYSYDAGVITTSFLVWTLKDGQVEFIGQTKASAVPSARFEDGILCIQDGSILAKYKKVSDTPSAPDCEELSQGAADDDRSTWDYDDYVNYYGFDPADYGYMWYNEVRSGPLDEFFEWANEELTQTDNSSRLYSISDPFNADLSPDDFVGTWETQNGIIFTIQYLDGEYTIDLSENNLGILGGRFSDYLYNVEDAFCGMAGTSGTTSFSVYYEYGSDYPTSSWLVLDLTESNGNEVLDYVPLT